MKDSYTEKIENTCLEVNYQGKGSYGYPLIQNIEGLSSSKTSPLKGTMERWWMMYTLCKMREILIQERNKGYYRNVANLKEIIELEEGSYMDENGVEYATKQKMQIYQNGMVDFFTLAVKKEKTKELIK